jgi:uncharacterized membrane protein
MIARRSATVAFAVVVTLLAVVTVYYLPLLPERMAIHFGANDAANGWSSKSSFLSTMVVTIASIGGLFAAAGQFRRLPVHLINVPN